MPAIASDSLPGFEEDLFGQILGLGVAAGAEVQVSVHPLDESVVQLAKRIGIMSGDDAIDELDDREIVGALCGLRRLCSRYCQT